MTQLATLEQANGQGVAARPTSIALSINDIWMLAENVAATKMFKGIDTPQRAFTLMMICESEGLHPMRAMQIYDIIDGKPAIKTSVVQARFIQGGGRIEMVRATKQEACAIFSHPVFQPTPIELSYTIEMARIAGLASKDNYKQNSEDMLWWRLMSKSLKKIAPGLINGIPMTEDAVEAAFAESQPSPEIQAKISEAEAVNAAGRNLPGPADLPVLGYSDSGADVRPYVRVAEEAVEAHNAAVAEAWQVVPGVAPPAVNVRELHRHVLFTAINQGHAEGPPPQGMTKAIGEISAVYKTQRAWVRGEIMALLAKEAEAAEAALHDALEAANAEAVSADDYGGAVPAEVA